MTPVCAVCHHGSRTKRNPRFPYASGPWNQTCGRRRCVATLGDGTARVRRLNQAHRAAADARMQAVVGFQFGPLSPRERELFKFVWGRAYQRGYNKGRSHAAAA